MKFQRILLAVDSDGLAAHAAEAATFLARAAAAEVRVLHVGSPGEPSQMAEQMASELRARGIRAQSLVRSGGSVAQLIGEAAREFAADLVVMGTHGRSTLGAAVHHSLSRTAATRLDMPVMLVPTAEGRALSLRRIMVAIDRSHRGEEALELAADLASFQLAQVMVVHALDFLPFEDPLAEIERDRIGEEILLAAASRLRDRHLSAETRLLPYRASIAREIANAAREWNADVLVMGSRRAGSWGSLLLGSVSQDVLHLGHMPVLLAPRAHSSPVPAQRPAGMLSGR